MYINRIVLRDVRNFSELDVILRNNWTEEPLQSVLITGPNGTGKTTLLRIIAALWENVDNWLRLGKALNAEQQAQRNIFSKSGLAAIEIRDLLDQPLWLYIAEQPDYQQFLDSLMAPDDMYVGEVSGKRGRPTFNINGSLDELNSRKEKLQLGTTDANLLPNLVFLEASSRQITMPPTKSRPNIYAESLYQWFVTYEARDRWENHLESMLRNLKVRDPKVFSKTLEQINSFWNDKRLTDFDDDLRLQVKGKTKKYTHYIDELSSGEQQSLIMMFMVSRWLMPGGVVLIDEPDLHMHVSLQRYFIHKLEEVVLERKGQLIVTSHSPTLWEEYNDRQRIEFGELVKS